MSKEKSERVAKENIPTFSINEFGSVAVTFPDGEEIKSQSVEAHLLLAILKKLR